MDAKVLESRVRHGGDACGRERADAELNDVPVPHDAHDVLGDGLLFRL